MEREYSKEELQNAVKSLAQQNAIYAMQNGSLLMQMSRLEAVMQTAADTLTAIAKNPVFYATLTEDQREKVEELLNLDKLQKEAEAERGATPVAPMPSTPPQKIIPPNSPKPTTRKEEKRKIH